MRLSEAILLLALFVAAVDLFSLPSLADAQQYYPLEIAVDSGGRAYVMIGPGSVEPGIYVYAPDGAAVKCYRGDEYADLAIGGDGNLYLSNVRNNYVELIAKNGSSGIFWREDTPGRFIDYIAVDRDGNLYVTDFNISDNPAIGVSGRILKLSPGAEVLGVIESCPTVPMDRQFKLSVSDNGTIYMTDSDASIGAIYPDGGRSSITPAGTEPVKVDRLVDVAAGADGYLYVTESTGGYVLKLSPDGRVVTKWGGCGPEGFVTPFGVAAADNGRVYVSDMQNQRVVWLDAGRYRFGGNAADNLAGKGVLWDNVMDAGNMTAPPLPGYEILPPHDVPGYAAPIALSGLCLAGLFLCLRGARRN